tara:strand:+ start:483 stop:869 length:387 start_codon:yes stop_codon:yes gene_type:complete
MVAKEVTQRKKDNSTRDTIISIVVFLVLVIGPITFLVFNNVRMQQKRNELVEQERELRVQLEELEERKINLETSIDSINSIDSQEKILREQGLYKKPGEEVITIVPVESEPIQVVPEQGRVWWNPLTW